MERNREARRGTVLASANGLSKRRQRNSNFKDSPDEDVALELQETARLRDRGSKKDRDRDRSSRNKRRKAEKLGSNREEEGEESTEESVDDEEEEDDDDAAAMAVQSPMMNPTASTASFSTSTPNHHQRKSFPPKIVRPASPWKTDEMIGVSVPRKARSASVKRSHECSISGGGGSNGGEPIPRHDSTSPARSSLVAAAPVPPISPTSSNASVRKKMKPTGTKQRPPKISKPPSSIQEIEFEIAEVLFGMTKQVQCPTRKDTSASVSEKLDPNDAKASSSDAKSRVSSPIASSAVPQPSVLPQDSISTAVAPKRKRPRALKSEDENPANFAFPNVSVSSECKVEIEQQAEVEISSPKSEKNSVAAFENGGESLDHISSVPIELTQDVVKTESNSIPDSDPRMAEPDGGDMVDTKEECAAPVEESACAEEDADLEDAMPTKMESSASAADCPREERFKIDLMAPPSGKSSPERDDMVDFVTDKKPVSLDSATVLKEEIVRAEEKANEITEDAGEIGFFEKKTETMAEDNELKKQMVKERTFDLQLDVEKLDKDVNKFPVQKQQSKATRNDSKSDKAVQSVPLPLPLTIASWQSGVPPIGYMGQIPPPLQTAVSMEGGTTSSSIKQPHNFFLPPPRPKRCASHCYIARCIKCHKQSVHTNLFWPGPAASALPTETKQCNLNVAPPNESAMLGNSLHILRNLNPSLDNGPGVPSLVRTLKDKSSQAMSMETAQKKQFLPPQAPQPAPNNNMMAPAFIFPLNQHQAAAMTPGALNSVSTIGNAASSSSGVINSVVGSSSSSVSGSAATMSFNYANLPPSEAQYFAMLQSNNGCPFPIPTHIGAPPPYRGSPHAVMPLFNGSFYPPHMIHPSQLQQQHQQSQPQPPVVQPGNQNTSTSSGSSSSHKHQQQQRLQGCGSNDGSGISQSFPSLKQCQQPQQYLLPPRQPENDVGNHESPSAANSKVSQAQKSIYTHNFAMPIHPNFALMSPAVLAGRTQGEKQQQQSLKGRIEFNQSQAIAMSFATFSGATATPSLDFSTVMQSHAIFPSLPEAARHGCQIAASAPSSHCTQQKAAHQSIEEKPASASINSNASGEHERKMTAKASTSFGHTLTFSRPDNEPSIPTIFGNSVVDSSSRNLSLIPTSGNGNRSVSRSSSAAAPVTAGLTTVANTPSSQHHQQLIQMQKQQQHLAVQAKSASSNANIYSDHLASSMGKFPNGISVFPQALAQSNSPSQSPQWKSSAKAGTAPIHSPSQTSISSSKSIPQQQCRAQLGGPAAGHKQISFGVNTRSSGPQFQSNNLAPPSASVVVGSPPSSISKSGEGSPRSTTGSASVSTMPLPSQPQKNTVSSSSRKSSPVGNQHVLPILSNSNASCSQTSTTKHHQQPQNQHYQLQQHQLYKQPFPHSSQFYPNIYMQAQSPQSTTALPTPGYYQKRQSEQQQQRTSQSVSSNAMFSLCSTPVTFSGVAVSDPAKAFAAAATGNQKGLSQQGPVHAAQFTSQSAGNPHIILPTAMPYMHSVPLKSAEQKPAAGN